MVTTRVYPERSRRDVVLAIELVVRTLDEGGR